jgi:hypothetical protein
MSTLEHALEEQRIDQILHETRPAARSIFAKYLVFLAVIPLIVYLATFPLMMTPRLPHLGFSKFGPVLDYSFDINHLDADVVIFGDSSAFLGVDPHIVTAETGLRTVVMPNTVGSLPTTGDMALRRYLEHNRKPRLLVLYFSAWSLDYNDPNYIGLNFEGEEELLRHGSFRDVAQFALHHPIEFLLVPFRAYITLGVQSAIKYFHDPDRLGETAAALGHMDYTLPYPVLTQPCRIPARYLSRVKDDSVRQLVQQYQTLNIPVVVYLAPIPDCAGAAIVTHQSHAGLPATSPAIEPASWFASDTYLAHIRPEHVKENSHFFAEALRSWTGPIKPTPPTQTSEQTR